MSGTRLHDGNLLYIRLFRGFMGIAKAFPDRRDRQRAALHLPRGIVSHRLRLLRVRHATQRALPATFTQLFAGRPDGVRQLRRLPLGDCHQEVKCLRAY